MDNSIQTQSSSQFHHHALIWDAHGCFPLTPHAELDDLARYKNAGVDFLSINVGMDHTPWTDVIHIIAGFRRYIELHSEQYVLIHTVDDITQAKTANKLAIAFDLEGSVPLNGNINMVSFYYDLGVKQMLLAYNKNNEAAGGCLDQKQGLTQYGRDIIHEMNRVGMIVDVSHMSYQSSMDAMSLSNAPVVFSHSNPAKLWQHRRNIQDDQMRACAQTGGVVGINGIGHFLLNQEITATNLVKHIDYAVNLIGIEHVGIGLDYVVDESEMQVHAKENPDVYPGENFADCQFARPEQFPEFTEVLFKLGYTKSDVALILGGNFYRVAKQVWK